MQDGICLLLAGLAVVRSRHGLSEHHGTGRLKRRKTGQTRNIMRYGDGAASVPRAFLIMGGPGGRGSGHSGGPRRDQST